MQFGPDGNLYVVSSATRYEQVFRFDGTTGAFIDDLVIATGERRRPGNLVHHVRPAGCALCEQRVRRRRPP